MEQAFQQAVLDVSDAVPSSTTVRLTAAVHDMDIDQLLQKLVCGEIEYNPHDSDRYNAHPGGLIIVDDGSCAAS